MSQSAFSAAHAAYPSQTKLKTNLFLWSAVLLLAFVSLSQGVQAQTPPIYYINSGWCASAASPCGGAAWVTQPAETIEFAGFPGCYVEITYDMRICPDGTVELRLNQMASHGTCGLLDAAIAADPNFLSDRWREAFETVARIVAENQASGDPDYRCPPHGIKTKTVRSYTASCARYDNSVIEIDVMMPVLDTNCATSPIWCCPPNLACPPAPPATYASGIAWPPNPPTPGTILNFVQYSYYKNVTPVGPGCWSFDICTVKQRKDINGNLMWIPKVLRIPTVVKIQCGETCCKEEIAFCWQNNVRQETITFTPPAYPDPCYAPCKVQCSEPMSRPGVLDPKGVR